MIMNYPEIAVKETYDDVLRRFKENNPDICDCDQCRNDVMALALNNLPVKYVVSHVGRIYTKNIFDQIGGRTQVMAALLTAMQKVHQNPRH